MCEVTIKGHVSTLEALKYILKFNIIILRNGWRFLNRLVHRYPWVFIIATIAVSVLISLIQIGSARALNQQLSNAGIQYFQSGSWHLKGKYREWQLASTRTYNYIKGDGSTGTKVNLVWNQRGKRFILALYNNDFNVKDAIAEINGEKRAALVSKNNQSNF